MRVELSVANGPLQPFKAPFPHEDLRGPWADRPKVELRVGQDETIEAAFGRALDELGVEITEPYWSHEDDPVVKAVTFFSLEDDEVEYEPQLRTHDLTVVCEDGSVEWSRTIADTTFADLVRTAEAGLLAGDPRRVNIMLHPPAGDGGFLAFALIVVGFEIATRLLSIAANTEGAIQFVERLRARTQQGHDALKGHVRELEERGARADTFYELMHKKSWTAEELGERLNCSQDVAEGFLLLYGYSEGQSGLWRRGMEDDAVMVRRVYEDIDMTWSTDPQQFQANLEGRLTHLIEKGEPAPRDDGLSLPDFAAMTEDDLRDYRLGQGEFEPQEYGEDEPDQPEDADDDEVPDLSDLMPLEDIVMKCRCGDPDCRARLEWSVRDKNVRMGLAGVVDHFEIEGDFLVTVMMVLADRMGLDDE